jgi:pimeloyl-ACP methyl ester carboxylesterase
MSVGKSEEAKLTEPGERFVAVPFETQDYVSKQYGDARIDCYITEPTKGVLASTGLMLLIHGWGNDGSVSYRDDAAFYADEFDFVVVRVEYRDCGREAHHPESPRTFDRPYDFSKLQTIDSLRAAHAALERYPHLDRRRLVLWGGSQGAHIAAQCLVFAPELWSAAVLCCGLYIPLTFERQVAGGFAWDVRNYPGMGFVEYALGPGTTFDCEREFDIRNTVRNAHLISGNVPVAIIHGTVDDNVDIRHAVELHARMRALGKRSTFVPIPNGDHGLGGAELEDENSRLKATLKHASHLLSGRRHSPGTWKPDVHIPVTGGEFRVCHSSAGPSLNFVAGA